MILALLTLPLPAAFAGGDAVELVKQDWPFDGAFGTIDKQSAQRGYQVYKDVCASCHGLKRVAYRDLTKIGFTEDEVKAIAAQATVKDGPNDAGEMFERPGRPSDKFVSPFPNDNAAKASNNGALPPDLSLMVKARPDGANYLFSLLAKGYDEEPAPDIVVGEGLYYNEYFPGHQIAMPPPLTDGLVSYIDGTEASKDQMSKDVVNFLQWAAEPEMEHRKGMGAKVMLFLLFVTVLFYFTNRKAWKDVK